MPVTVDIEKTVVVQATVYDVVAEGGYDLDFEVDVDGDGDIRVEVTETSLSYYMTQRYNKQEIIEMFDIEKFDIRDE